MEQRVEHRSMRGWRGIALVAAAAALVILMSNVFYALGRYIGGLASFLFIACGFGVAWFMLRRYVEGFLYACDGACLRVARTYGRRRRPIADVWLNGVQGCGSLAAMRQRFPGARVQRAVKPECAIEPLAVAYNDAGRVAIVVLQPNEELRDTILRAAKR